MRIAFTTLGCKINQFETDVIRRDLIARGNTIVPFDSEADVYIINTCSVTAKSDYQCRQVIRSAARRGNSARIVVTGCYAETRPDEIRNIPGVDLVIGNRDKPLIADRIMSIALPGTDPGALLVRNAPLQASVSRTRGFLKIQDGCDNRCSYCIVPLARGISRSAHPDEVVREFGQMVQAGCPEVVLTGIHIGTYGADLDEGITLTDMVRRLLSVRGCSRIRLSSIEPGEITDGLIEVLGDGLCRHLHIPLQSGDDGILSSMKRRYTAGFYLELLERISRRVPHIALGADVMVGFPGEGEREFQNTLDLVERSPLTHLHVFSYSPRPGTPAAEMKPQVPELVKKQRSAALRNLSRKKNLAFRQTNTGVRLSVVVEDKVDLKSGLFTGLTDNYIRVQCCGVNKNDVGKEIEVGITEVDEESTVANIVN
ncbi:MAG TPA: tRNA (N(6)-L-threonylcarbamoyladenosine(37)-C(2))-methylthiotransferase MtaB [Nitrospirota bacterium]